MGQLRPLSAPFPKMPKPYTKSKKPVLTLAQRYDMADKKEQKRKAAEEKKLEEMQHREALKNIGREIRNEEQKQAEEGLPAKRAAELEHARREYKQKKLEKSGQTAVIQQPAVIQPIQAQPIQVKPIQAQPVQVKPAPAEDPDRTESDDDVRIIAVERIQPIKPVESKPPAKHNPDDSDTE